MHGPVNIRHLFSTVEMSYIQERCLFSFTVHRSEQLRPVRLITFVSRFLQLSCELGRRCKLEVDEGIVYVLRFVVRCQCAQGTGSSGVSCEREGRVFVESIRSYCTLEPSTGNLCLLPVITVELLFLGLSEPNGWEKRTYITSVRSQQVTCQENGHFLLDRPGGSF